MDFYNHLNYSLGNEDWLVEKQALRVCAGDRVICVTASGDRPLHLLMTDCKEVISIDMNSIQNFLLELKLVAIERLDFEKYLAFLGCTETPHRYQIFKEIRHFISNDAASYWEHKKKLIVKGVIYQGAVERLTAFSAKCFNLFFKKKIKTLFALDDLETQREYLKKEWDTLFLRKTFDFFLNPNIVQYLIKDPGLNAYLDPAIRPGKYIYQRMLSYLQHHLAKKSALLQLVLTGKITSDAYYPYLTYDGYKQIKKHLHRLTFKTDNIIKFLKNAPHQSINAFSMSDIASYMPQAVFEQLLDGMYHAATPDARFCIREFMSKRYIPDRFSHSFDRHHELEKKLELEEPHFVYRFLTGEIKK